MKKLASLWFSILSACQHSPPDFHGCVELEPSRAYCCTVVTGNCRFVDEKTIMREGDNTPTIDKNLGSKITWWELRPYTIQIPFFDYQKLRAWIVEECKVSGKCDSTVTSWDSTLGNLDHIVDQKQP